MSKNTTKMAISYAFKELLLEKPYNKITVNDISERCGINRQTFYYHFLDIPNMVEWICNDDVSKVINFDITYENWQESFLLIFELLEKDKAFIMNIYHHVSHEILTNFLHQATYRMLMQVLEEKSSNIKVSQTERVFIANFYKYGFVGLVLDWVNHDMQEDPHLIIERLDSLIKGSFQQALIHSSN